MSLEFVYYFGIGNIFGEIREVFDVSCGGELIVRSEIKESVSFGYYVM